MQSNWRICKSCSNLVMSEDKCHYPLACNSLKIRIIERINMVLFFSQSVTFLRQNISISFKPFVIVSCEVVGVVEVVAVVLSVRKCKSLTEPYFYFLYNFFWRQYIIYHDTLE